MLLLCPLLFAQQPPEANAMALFKKAYLPRYPLMPSGAREAGEVVVSLTLDSKGSVLSTESSGASERLRHERAELAASEWRFDGNTKSLSVVFSFTLYEKAEAQCRPSITLGNPIRVKVREQKKAEVVISDPPMVDLSKPRKH